MGIPLSRRFQTGTFSLASGKMQKLSLREEAKARLSISDLRLTIEICFLHNRQPQIVNRRLPDALYLIRHPLFVGAPPGIRPVGASMEDGFNPADIAFFDLKELCELPGPIDLFMVEKAESENNPALSIDVFLETSAVARAFTCLLPKCHRQQRYKNQYREKSHSHGIPPSRWKIHKRVTISGFLRDHHTSGGRFD
jgi:hypothetical protein